MQINKYKNKCKTHKREREKSYRASQEKEKKNGLGWGTTCAILNVVTTFVHLKNERATFQPNMAVLIEYNKRVSYFFVGTCSITKSRNANGYFLGNFICVVKQFVFRQLCDRIKQVNWLLWNAIWKEMAHSSK